jgi:hypothetical protein
MCLVLQQGPDHTCCLQTPKGATPEYTREVVYSTLKRVLLSFDGKVYVCQFGCPNDVTALGKNKIDRNFKMSGVLKHLLEEHSETELRKWGLSLRVLNLAAKYFLDSEVKLHQQRPKETTPTVCEIEISE